VSRSVRYLSKGANPEEIADAIEEVQAQPRSGPVAVPSGLAGIAGLEERKG